MVKIVAKKYIYCKEFEGAPKLENMKLEEEILDSEIKDGGKN